MKKKEKKLVSWKEAYKINNRAFLLLYKHYPRMMLSCFIHTIWNAVTPYITIYLSALIIDELAGRKNAQRLQELIVITLILQVLIGLIGAFLTRWRNYENSGSSFKMERIFTNKLLEMDFIDIDNNKVHDLLYSIRQTAGGAGWGLERVISNYETIISAIVTIFSGIALTISLFTNTVPKEAESYVILNNPWLLVLIIVMMLAITYIAPILSTKANSYWVLNVKDHNAANRLFSFHSNFMGLRGDLAADLRIYQQNVIITKHSKDKTLTFNSKGIFASYAKGPMGFYSAASAAVSVTFTGIVYIFVCLKAWAGAFPIGAVTRYIASITKVSQGVSALISAIGDMRNNASFLAETFKFLDIENTMYQGSLTVEKRSDHDYEIEFSNVSFQYPGSSVYALKNVTIKFRIGERLAVVGMNGSGKTTFIKLLCRLYDPTEGEILLNGINIKKYNYSDYMSIFSIVFQDFNLFSFPLGQNIAARVKYQKEKAEACLERAGFKERLVSMPEGLETYLYKHFKKTGVEISGGEAQKIALARTLYKKSAFVVLDEPTAALDPVAEAEIYHRFNEIAEDKTTIYISHRLSSCQFCDEIIVFHEGTVIQQGAHNELVMNKNGKYYEMWQAQAQYYI